MRLGLQDIKWEYIGAKLATADDNKQAAFLKAFVKECLSWGTRYQVGVQLAGVNHLLTSEEREVLSQITYEEENNEEKT